MSTTHQTRSIEIANKTASFVQNSSEALELSVSIINRYRESEKKASEVVPALVGRLRQLGLIDAGEEKQAAAELNEPANALHILNEILDKYAEAKNPTKQAGLQGRGVDGDGVAAAVQTKKSSFHAIGERNFSGVPRESDLAMLRLVSGR